MKHLLRRLCGRLPLATAVVHKRQGLRVRPVFYLLFVSGMLLASCRKDESCEGCPPEANKPPVASAGVDGVTVLPKDSVLLDGSASADPDGRIVRYQWRMLGGPTVAVIPQPDADKTIARALAEGTYFFELQVTDDKGAPARDTVQVVVARVMAGNLPPVARAGDDQALTLPDNSATLDGSVSYDPDGTIASYMWTVIASPSALTINAPATVRAGVSGLGVGVYRFQLEVTDNGGLSAKDTVQVTVMESASTDTACDNSHRAKVAARLVPFASLSQPRIFAAIAAAGTKIVFAGGKSSAACSNTWCEDWGSSRVDIYDVVSHTWSTAELSTRRFGIATAVAGTKIFFAGGESGDGAFNAVYASVDIYDAATGQWTVASLSEPRSYVSAAVAGDKVVFAGGEINDQQTSNRVDIYDLSSGTWTRAQLSEARAGISALTVNNKIYFAGGWRTRYWDYLPSRRIDIWDQATASWSVASLDSVSGALGSIAVDQQLYWVESCIVEQHDMATGNRTHAYLSTPGVWIRNEGNNLVLKDNKIIFFRHYPETANRFDIYDLATSTWSIGVLPDNFIYSSIISVNNTIYVAGGIINYTGYYSPTSQVWKLEF